jgi:hypothetical protein
MMKGNHVNASDAAECMELLVGQRTFTPSFT